LNQPVPRPGSGPAGPVPRRMGRVGLHAGDRETLTDGDDPEAPQRVPTLLSRGRRSVRPDRGRDDPEGDAPHGDPDGEDDGGHPPATRGWSGYPPGCESGRRSRRRRPTRSRTCLGRWNRRLCQAGG
jgi:hypothetical protein